MKIYNKDVPKEILTKLLNEIYSGKYKDLGIEIVEKEIKKELTNNPSLIEKIEKKKFRTPLVKKIKKTLYPGIAAFAKTKNSEEHHSTKDREYEVLKQVIKQIKPKSIVDLGCGLNTLNLQLFANPKEYYGFEINQTHVSEDNKYLKQNNIKGEVFCADIHELKILPPADCYLLLLFLESFEQTSGHKKAEELLKKIPSQNIIVSFSTYTLGGNPMNVPKRRWFELLIDRLEYKYDYTESENEQFYTLHKKII